MHIVRMRIIVLISILFYIYAFAFQNQNMMRNIENRVFRDSYNYLQ